MWKTIFCFVFNIMRKNYLKQRVLGDSAPWWKNNKLFQCWFFFFLISKSLVLHFLCLISRVFVLFIMFICLRIILHMDGLTKKKNSSLVYFMFIIFSNKINNVALEKGYKHICSKIMPLHGFYSDGGNAIRFN